MSTAEHFFVPYVLYCIQYKMVVGRKVHWRAVDFESEKQLFPTNLLHDKSGIRRVQMRKPWMN